MSIQGEVRSALVAPVGEMVATLVMAVASGMRQGAGMAVRIARALKNRAVVSQLASLDDRMLSDIGITRSDVRDAASVSLLQDPSRLLVARAVERRAAVRLNARTRPWQGDR